MLIIPQALFDAAIQTIKICDYECARCVLSAPAICPVQEIVACGKGLGMKPQGGF